MPRLPLVILAGGESKDEIVAGQEDRISGSKGIRIQYGGRPLIDLVVERFAACGVFDPILIAGPAQDYGERRGPARVIDTDGEFADNIRAGLDAALEHSGGNVFFTTCDLVPEVEELERVLEDYFNHAPLDFWYPVIEAPEDSEALGASAYKRQYRVRPPGERRRVNVLPGHLVMVDASALRLEVLYEAFELAYRTRTQHVAWRTLYIATWGARLPLKDDLRSLRRGRRPLFTLDVLRSALPLAVSLAGTSSLSRNESRIRRLFVTPEHRRAHPDRRGRIPLLAGMSLALDIDTQKEADEHQLEVAERRCRSREGNDTVPAATR